MGAMVIGGVTEGRIRLNEGTHERITIQKKTLMETDQHTIVSSILGITIKPLWLGQIKPYGLPQQPFSSAAADEVIVAAGRPWSCRIVKRCRSD